jgi:ribulose-phosphate 3-epimerase
MVDVFAPAADAISVHLEADPHPHRLLAQIREHGCLAGLALNPGTPVEAAADLLGDLDYVNVLAVDPGFAGQRFIARSTERIARLAELVPDGVLIEVDGGIDPATLPGARDAGASLFVSASAIFGHDDPPGAFAELAGIAAAG